MFEELYETKPAAHASVATEVATTKAVDVALQDLDLQAIALAHFDASRVAVKTATEKLTDVAHDLSTAGKLADAKSLRNRLINIPLAEARKVSAGLKSKLTGTSKAVGAELASIEAGFESAEKLITPQIEARDAEVAAEKAERDRVEAERVGVHRANIGKLASYVSVAHGKTSEQILTIINGVSGIDILPEQWEEFAVGAEIQKADTLEALQALFNSTKTAEDEAAAREAQRIENERIAAALAEQQRILAEKQADLDRQLAEIAAAKQAEADRVAAAARAQRDAEAKALADAAAAAHQAAEDEANRLAQEAAALAALQRTADTTPADVLVNADSLEADRHAVEVKLLGESTHAAIDSMFPGVLASAPEAATPAHTEHTGHYMAAVSPGLLHLTPEAAQGPIALAGDEPTVADPICALTDHIHASVTRRFPTHPKPTAEWWAQLRRLTEVVCRNAETPRCYYAVDGTLMNPDGTRSIFDDVDL